MQAGALDASGGDTVYGGTVMESSIKDGSLKHHDKPAGTAPVVMATIEDSWFSFCSQIVVRGDNLCGHMEPCKP